MENKNDYHKLNEEKLLELLNRDNELIEKIIQLGSESLPVWFYSIIIRFMTGLECNDFEAKLHYLQIVSQREAMSNVLNRDIGIRVAALDYFYNIEKQLKNPRIIEAAEYETMEKMTLEDSKTGCYNARFLKEYVEKEISKAKRYGEKLSVIMIDIDDFKELNDGYGHLYGDEVIKVFAEVLEQACRSEDVIARFGGDEFTIALPQTGRIGARCLAERIKHRLESIMRVQGYLSNNSTITFSAGIATFPYDAMDYEGLIGSADTALYKSKILGKNKITNHEEEIIFNGKELNFERRDHPRVRKENNENIFTIEESEMNDIKGKVLDVSRGGILLECGSDMEKSEIEKISQITLSNKQDMKDLRLQGEVVRTYQEEGKFGYYLGMKFKKELNDEQWRTVINYNQREESRMPSNLV